MGIYTYKYLYRLPPGRQYQILSIITQVLSHLDQCSYESLGKHKVKCIKIKKMLRVYKERIFYLITASIDLLFSRENFI